jgi:hypothetical protein
MFYSFSGLAYQEFIANLDFKTLKIGQTDPGSASLRTFFSYIRPPFDLNSSTFCTYFSFFTVSILFLLLTVITSEHTV